MLSQADLELIARDPALPGLALVLDPDAVAARLGGRAEPLHLRYKPGRSCVATFDTSGGIRMLRAVTARRFAKLARRGHWPEGAELWPEDAVAVMRPEHDRSIVSPTATGAELLRFKPERRVVWRTEGGTMKALTPDAFPRAQAGADFGAKVLLADPDRALLETGWVEGTPADRAHDPATHHAIGARLAELHRTPSTLPPLPPLEVPPALTDLAELLPDLAQRIAQASDRLTLALAMVPRDDATCHGDFSADQAIVGDSVRFIDWDRAGKGEPARDIGTYLARLEREGRDDLAPAFLQGYGALPDGVAACHAAALAALATEPFRLREPDWHDRTLALLDRIEALIPATDPLALATDAAVMNRLLGGIETATLFRLKEGRRAVIRYDGPRPMIGKLRFRGPDRTTPALHAALREAGLPVPAPVAEYPAAHLWVQEAVAGTPPTTAADFAASGASLAMLHAARVPAPRDWSMADEIAVLERALDGIAPDLARGLAARVLALPEAEPTGIHRDFYPDQVLIKDGTAWLLDLDLYAWGDPAIDIANFLAHLDEAALRAQREPSPKMADAFLAGYARHLPLPDPERIAALRELSLARHLRICQRFDDRRHESPLILNHLGRGSRQSHPC